MLDSGRFDAVNCHRLKVRRIDTLLSPSFDSFDFHEGAARFTVSDITRRQSPDNRQKWTSFCPHRKKPQSLPREWGFFHACFFGKGCPVETSLQSFGTAHRHPTRANAAFRTEAETSRDCADAFVGQSQTQPCRPPRHGRSKWSAFFWETMMRRPRLRPEDFDELDAIVPAAERDEIDWAICACDCGCLACVDKRGQYCELCIILCKVEEED